MTRFVIGGSRELGDDHAMYWMKRILMDHLCSGDRVATGGCRGADSLAERIAQELNISTVVYPADWDQHGRKAGPLRNRMMLDTEHPDAVIAFPLTKGSKGTLDLIHAAIERGIEVYIYPVPEEES